MSNNGKTERTAYQKLTKAAILFALIFIIGICILGIAFVMIGKYTDAPPQMVWPVIIAVYVWCGGGFLTLHVFEQKKKNLRIAAGKTERPEISNPLFKELFDEYEFSQLEEFTHNMFFRKWKLTAINDHDNTITLCFKRKQHEITIELSEDLVSITIDANSDSPIELSGNMGDFSCLDEIFNSITATCWQTMENLDKQSVKK